MTVIPLRFALLYTFWFCGRFAACVLKKLLNIALSERLSSLAAGWLFRLGPYTYNSLGKAQHYL